MRTLIPLVHIQKIVQWNHPWVVGFVLYWACLTKHRRRFTKVAFVTSSLIYRLAIRIASRQRNWQNWSWKKHGFTERSSLIPQLLASRSRNKMVWRELKIGVNEIEWIVFLIIFLLSFLLDKVSELSSSHFSLRISFHAPGPKRKDDGKRQNYNFVQHHQTLL